MEEENEVISPEPYTGADNDTIEVPEEARTILADQDGAEAQAEQQPDDEEPEQREERRRRKRGEYQQRINELTREKHEEREARAAAEAKAELLEQRLREMEEGGRSPANPDLKQREQELVEKRRLAEEDGDLTAYTEAQDELFEVRLKLRQAEQRPAPRTTDEAEGGDGAPQQAPEAVEWLSRNKWFHQPENRHLAAEVERLEGELLRSGYNLNSPEQAKKVYEEIDRRIRERPEFDAVLDIGEPEQEEQQEREPERTPRSHIAPPSRGGEAPPRPKPGALTQYDIRTMKQYGLDPNDPKVRAAYLKRKRA